MKFILTVSLLICTCVASYSQKYDLKAIVEIDLGHALGQFRAVPVSLGKNRPKAIAAMYSEDAEIDPYIGMFFFPKHTLKMMVFNL